MSRFLISLMLVISLPSWAQFDLKFDRSDSGVAEFKSAVMAQLPSFMKTSIGREVAVRFERLDRQTSLQDPCTARDNEQVFGREKGGVITLNINFLPQLVKKTTEGNDFACGHRTYYRLAMATLIHELAHLFDSARANLSKSQAYLSLARGGKNLLGVAKIKNRKMDRLPDPYEIKSPSEHFAVNTEFFLLDPEYACHRPNLSSYLAIQYSKHVTPCRPNMKLRIYDGKATSVRDLNPSMVKAIHYLHADKGPSIMSRFGHAMFRIETLNPAEDLVVGFSGQPDDTVIDGFKGLTGEYASRVQIKPLKQVVDDYTKTQLRGLTSYPLSLSAQQKTAFLQEILTLHWEYAGRYYFFTTNCATEAWSLMKATLQSDLAFKRKATTPLGLRKHLLNLKIASVATAQRFPSYEETLRKVFGRIQPHLIDVSFRQFMDSDSAERREMINALPELTRVELYAFLSLEMTLLSREEKSLEADLLVLIHKLPANHPLKAISNESIALSNELSFGHNVAIGYGIPTTAQFRPEAEAYFVKTEARLGELFAQMGIWMKNHFQAELQSLQGGQETLALIQTRLAKNKDLP